MPRPRNCRRVGYLPQVTFYKPQGIPLSVLQHIALTFDELEAIRLADLEGMYQEQAAEKMNVSRQTFGRIVELAHKKIADALVNGKALSIAGGHIEIDNSQANNGDAGFAPGCCRTGRHGHRRGQQE
jgi:uncharacterized protein